MLLCTTEIRIGRDYSDFILLEEVGSAFLSFGLRRAPSSGAGVGASLRGGAAAARGLWNASWPPVPGMILLSKSKPVWAKTVWRNAAKIVSTSCQYACRKSEGQGGSKSGALWMQLNSSFWRLVNWCPFFFLPLSLFFFSPRQHLPPTPPSTRCLAGKGGMWMNKQINF